MAASSGTGKASGSQEIAAAARIISAAKRLVVLTGAGVSKESGIPTFRDAMTGLWANYDPQKLATPEGFLMDPPLVWQWYDFRLGMLDSAKPNPGHYAIRDLESLVDSVVVVTQNVDGLHQEAGSSDVRELHGSIRTFFCFEERHPAQKVERGLKEPPKCHCGSLLRPGVVWFGEMLPADVYERAQMEIAQADVVLVVGTSGIVQPAASLPYIGKRAGAKVIVVDPDPTPFKDVADVMLFGPSGILLPQVVDVMRISAAN